jgi:membrane-anchored mycosin MYCP
MSETDLAGRGRAFSRPQIVVAYKHLARVKAALDDLDIKWTQPVEPDRDLGLGLLQLENDVAAAWALREFDPQWKKVAPSKLPKGPSRSGRPPLYLDSFLRGLRHYFAKKYAGWKPMVGKNRLVGLVSTTPGKVSHGGAGPLMKNAPALKPRKGELGAGVVVGVLDTAMTEHPWFAGGWTSPPDQLRQADETLCSDLPEGGTRPNAAVGHASFVTGLILKQAPGCVVDVRKVLTDEGKASAWDVATAIVQLALTKPDIINLSLVCYTEDGEPPLVLATAIDRIDPDIVIIAAAGNHGDSAELELSAQDIAALVEDLELTEEQTSTLSANELEQMVRVKESRKPGWPAAFDRVIAVGSGHGPGTPSSFTPSKVGWIDVLADGDGPGGKGVHSTFPKGCFSVTELKRGQTVTEVREFTTGFARWGGTSFAAAKVSGAIAAGTRPGSVSARQAWRALVEAVPSNTSSSEGDDVPPFVDVPPAS